MLSEKNILAQLLRGEIRLPPLCLRPVAAESPGVDTLAEVHWQQRTFRFAVECKADSTPRSIRDAIGQLTAAAPALQANPLLIVPWLSPEQLGELEQQQISGIDLNGNGIVIVPGQLLVLRTGQPNRYPQSRPIRNVYRGDSSIVSRVFLLQPAYGGVGRIRDAIQARASAIAFSTASKVLKALEADLIVGRETGVIRLLQPEKLLERLAANYRPPKVQERWIGKCELDPIELGKVMVGAGQASDRRLVLTGASSVNRYATMAREPVTSIYCDDSPKRLLEQWGLPVEQDARFPNLELIGTDEPNVYFDRRVEPEGIFASPVQTWLELATGEKRQREIAEQVKTRILSELAATAGGRP